MNVRKSQRAFVGVTLTTVLSIAFVLIVYAALLANIPGGEVVVSGGLTGQVTYSSANVEPGSWTTELSVGMPPDDWYARFTTTGSEYVGPVEITWQLQKKGALGDWSDATDEGTPTTTNIVLTSASQTIYATSDGTGPSGNRDWSLTASASASYRVVVTIDSTG